MQRRVLIGVAAAVLLVAVGVAVQRSSGSSPAKVSLLAQSGGSGGGAGASTTTAPVAPSTTTTTPGLAPEAPTTTASTTSTTVRATTTTMAPPTSTSQPPGTSRTGTADLTFGGVLSGHLAGAVAQCDARPTRSSGLTVNGTLNGTPWVLFVQSYTGQDGVWQVLTGQAGGATGMLGQGYATTATYPATIPGVTQLDWAQGATLHVTLTSRADQAPAGDVEIQGTITCTH